MSDLVEFFTSQEIIVVYFVVIAASVLCFMIYLVEKNNVRARRRHNTRELNKLVKDSIYFSNFYSQVSVGTSSDTEFTFNTSLMPSNNGTVFVSYFNRQGF